MNTAVGRLAFVMVATTGCVSTMDGPRVTYFKPGDTSSYISCIEQESKQIGRDSNVTLTINGRSEPWIKSEFTTNEVWSKNFEHELSARCFRKLCEGGAKSSCREDGNRAADTAPKSDGLTDLFGRKVDPAANKADCDSGDPRACSRIYDNLFGSERSSKTGLALKQRICSNPDARCFGDPDTIKDDDRARLEREGFTERITTRWWEAEAQQILTVYFRTPTK